MTVKSKGAATPRRGRRTTREGPALDRVRLTRILTSLVRRKGLQALNMRSIAAAAHVSPRLLYSHVRDKSAMIDLVCEIITAQAAPDSVEGSWRARLTLIAQAMHRGLREYPGRAGVGAEPSDANGCPPEVRRLMDEVRRALADAGLVQPALEAAYMAFTAYTMGHLLIAAGRPGGRAKIDVDALFDAGLQQLLDGFGLASV